MEFCTVVARVFDTKVKQNAHGLVFQAAQDLSPCIGALALQGTEQVVVVDPSAELFKDAFGELLGAAAEQYAHKKFCGERRSRPIAVREPQLQGLGSGF